MSATSGMSLACTERLLFDEPGRLGVSGSSSNVPLTFGTAALLPIEDASAGSTGNPSGRIHVWSTGFGGEAMRPEGTLSSKTAACRRKKKKEYHNLEELNLSTQTKESNLQWDVSFFADSDQAMHVQRALKWANKQLGDSGQPGVKYFFCFDPFRDRAYRPPRPLLAGLPNFSTKRSGKTLAGISAIVCWIHH
ncbi:hypothetical protein OE88DRAFT_1645262 [Heliocybe sulcata]|uniref:Uncharacterized protein n=1 Tax=Heliocybe sulcata TaxID=5364 RepID=A0A5C3N1G9_9AGAM|nr:hypothetical protein OE88DRAFT_1645262 [Heliocybe sulcata]